MEEEIIIPSEQPELPAQVQVVDIQFRPGQKIYYFDPAGIPCQAGDHVIIDTARGPEYGTCVAGVHTISSKEIVAPLRPVLRIATAQDEKIAADNHAKEKIVKTYLAILGIKKKITVQFPTVQQIENQLMRSNINEIPKCKTVILGYVQGFEYLSNTENWLGTGDFLWKQITDDKILVGCKHSYWGDIAGYIVAALARKGVKRVIYVGKLGTLNKNYAPNETIATGNKSIFIDGSFVEWNNVFEDFNSDAIKNGIHYTLPSIIQETKEWVLQNREEIAFVDPEIGHMAKSAMQNGIDYSYLHIISDNLSKKFSEDLSNERKEDVLIKRKKLIKTIGNCLMDI